MNSHSKPLQEMASNGRDAPVMEIPVIDLGLLGISSTSSARELEKLRSALSTFGCFQAINHGIAPEFLNQVREIVKQFFQLPPEEKQKYSTEGYEPNGLVLSKEKSLDLNDKLFLVVYPEDQRKLKYWPENPETFRSVLHEYSTKILLITKDILRAMARSLNLEDHCFLDRFGRAERTLYASCNFYPSCPGPEPVDGFRPHTDGTAITLLLPDQNVEGLQFLRENQWFKAPVIPEALFINMGDQTEITSNGIFKSPVHRVVNPAKERISLGMLYVPDVDEIEPLEELVDDSRPRLYKKIKNYILFYKQHYEQGESPLKAARIQAE